jgi:pumilio RNA-binding family
LKQAVQGGDVVITGVSQRMKAPAQSIGKVNTMSGQHALSGRVWALARDPQGCREVQQALEAANDEERQAIALELQGHVWDAMRCPHANYVLQKSITMQSPVACQFVIDEILKKGERAIAQVARHKYGCRILQRLLEHCSVEQVLGLVDALLADSIPTCRHPYGNYVMQHMLEYGTDEQRITLIKKLEQHAPVVGADEYACAVIGKAMVCGQRNDQVALAQALAQVPETISFMARTRHGHVAARLVLQFLEGSAHEQARGQIRADAATLRGSRYGRLVVASLHQDGSTATAA